MKVLFADDKKTWHKLFEQVLKARGIEVVHAYTPKEALNKSVSEKPDAVILDVSLSTGTAYDVVSNISDLGVPVIVIGHRAEGFDREKALNLGAYEAIEKPFTVEDLLSVLRRVKKEKPQKEPETLELVVPDRGEVMEVLPVEKEEEPVSVEEVVPVGGDEPETIELSIEPLEESEELPLVPESEEEKVELEGLEEEKEVEKKTEEAVVQRTEEEVKELPLPQEKVEEIVREIAWEVIPEIAEKVIREEIEKLIKSRLA